MKKRGFATVTVVAVVFTLSCLLLLLCLSLPAPVLAQAGEPDLIITAIKPYHYDWLEEYDVAKGDPWFNLENYVEVTVVNNGSADAGSFKVKLYADGERIGGETVNELSADPEYNTTDVKFEWEQEGEDPLSWTDTDEGAICTYTDTSREYTLKAVVDEDDEVQEEDEENNEFTKEQKVVWNGYMADEQLENYVHDEVEGGILYTTGDGQYRSGESGDSGTEYGTYYEINYNLDIPGSTKLARLYIYYTWAKPSYKAPKIGVTLTTPSDDTHNLEMEKSYNDIKGDFGEYRQAWGTYAYDITECVKESGTYVASITNLNDGDDSDFATEYSFAAPAILVVYEDTSAPKREYWINEGADVLMGGREERAEGGFLALEECLNSATFDGEHLDLEVEEVILGIVSPWGDDEPDNVIYFNDEELGEGVYRGYYDSCSEEKGGISMDIERETQIGIAVIDVTDELEDSDNEVIQGDDGDNMMPANAFLVISYEEDEDEEEEEGGKVTPGPPNITAWNPVNAIVNNTEGESRTFTISVNQTVDISWQINGTEVQTNKSITEAAYASTSAVVGTWNVSAIATNTTTDLSDMHTWIWTVTPELTAVISDLNTAVEEGQGITSAENITTTPTSTPAITPTFTPTMEEKQKQKPGAEALVPGFELAISLLIVIAVAYLIRVRKRGGVE